MHLVQEAAQPEPDEEPDTRFFPALQLREVLVEVFAHSDNDALAAAARVSTKWSDAALDVLYRRSPELYNLLTILAPLNVRFLPCRATPRSPRHSVVFHAGSPPLRLGPL